jgi:hypothetical protein
MATFTLSSQVFASASTGVDRDGLLEDETAANQLADVLT